MPDTDRPATGRGHPEERRAGKRARTRAKEDQVLSHVRRVVALAVTVIGPALPALVIVLDGAKRW